MTEAKKKIKKGAMSVRLQLVDDALIALKQMSSVDLKRNSKGMMEFNVKVYDDDPETAEKKANKIVAALQKKYKV